MAPGSVGAQRLLPAGRAANQQGGGASLGKIKEKNKTNKKPKKEATGAAKKAAAAAKARE